MPQSIFQTFLPLSLLAKMCNVAPVDCLVPVHFTTFVFEDNLMPSKPSYKQRPSGILHYLACRKPRRSCAVNMGSTIVILVYKIWFILVFQSKKKKKDQPMEFRKKIPPTILVRESQKYEPCWKFPEAE